MKIQVPRSKNTAITFASMLEKLEILRSTLRWASSLERAEIQKLLRQCNELREEMLRLANRGRFVDSAKKGRAKRKKGSMADRRQALLERSFVFEGIFGDNAKLLAALEIAEKSARTDLPVLIDGESGTGKELMAKMVHANSGRSEGPLISVNCGAIPENLMESELFGHSKGAFTGATSDRKGKFESAHGGTIFLDEIGELPLQSQVKLLRVLQSNEIQRVGSDRLVEVDARVVAATNKNLKEMSREGTFREDLYYRLSVIEVTVPPLRERRDEIPLLQEYFCAEAAERLDRAPLAIDEHLQQFLFEYEYPGNIRELRNIIYRLSCLADDTAGLEHLPEELGKVAAELGPPVFIDLGSGALNEVRKNASDHAERKFLQYGLKEVNGRVVDLARRLEVNRPHLQTLLKKHKLSYKDYRKTDKAPVPGGSEG
jgi:transcriptional regulator with GAF, ATPase, and Fis domain